MNNETIITLRNWKKELEGKKELQNKQTNNALCLGDQIAINRAMIKKNTQAVYDYIWKKVLEIYEPYRLYDDETLLDAIRLGKTYINPDRYIADYVEERPNIVIQIPGTRYHDCKIAGLEDMDIWRILQDDGSYFYFNAWALECQFAKENIDTGFNHDFIFYIDDIKQLIEKSEKLIPNTTEEDTGITLIDESMSTKGGPTFSRRKY